MSRRPTSHAPPPPSEFELSERAQHLLKVLIDRYIREGQPVGSRSLSRDAGLELSPASIRNVMADLEELGFVSSPHTSAGRVPTAKGYRFFVDTLLTVKPLNSKEVNQLKRQLMLDKPAHGLVETASSLLSGITRLAGVVTVPRRHHACLRHVHFLPLSENRILAVVVADNQDVQNHVIQATRPFAADELQEMANYLNAQLAGKDLDAVRSHLVQELHEARESMDLLMKEAIDMAERVFEEKEPQEDDYVLAGETNLMTFHELSNVEKLRLLFDAFSQKREILHLLDQCTRAEGLQVFIGEESGYRVLDGCSVVTSPYSVDGEVVGVLGVIGPTRMAYERVIPIVDITARLLGAALNPRH